MEKMYFTQDEIVENTIHDYVKKANYNIVKMALYGLMAGMFIAIGAQGSLLSIHNISDAGVAKTVAGAVFPIGLMLIVLIGGQLFTGNCLLFMAAWSREITWSKVAKNLAVIWLTNILGAIFIAVMCYFSRQYDFNHGALGAYTIKNAVAKAGTIPLQGFLSGILCNITVCAAILMAGSAKDVSGKILGIFFTIFVFVISGFEHCIANAYYLPAGLLAKMNPQYVMIAKETYHLSAEQLDSLNISNALLHNILPVTCGNIIGGGVIIGGIMFLCHKCKKLK